MGKKTIVQLIRKHYPDVQAIYAFGSYGTEGEWPKSDVDIALLLSHQTAKQAGSLVLTALHLQLERALKKDVDLINLRRVSTVFQREIINSGNVLHCVDEVARQEFEMLVWSFYQMLNAERAGVLQAGLKTGRFYRFRVGASTLGLEGVRLPPLGATPA